MHMHLSWSRPRPLLRMHGSRGQCLPLLLPCVPAFSAVLCCFHILRQSPYISEMDEGSSSGPSDHPPTDTVAIPEIPEGEVAILVAFIQRQVAEAVEKTMAQPSGLLGVTPVDLHILSLYPHYRGRSANRHRLVRTVCVGPPARVISNALCNIHCRPYQTFTVCIMSPLDPSLGMLPHYPPLVPSPW